MDQRSMVPEVNKEYSFKENVIKFFWKMGQNELDNPVEMQLGKSVHGRF